MGFLIGWSLAMAVLFSFGFFVFDTGRPVLRHHRAA